MRRFLLLLALAGVLVTLCSPALAKGKRSVPQEDTRYEDSTGKRGLAGVEPGRYFEAHETIEPGPSRVAKAPASSQNATLPGAAPGTSQNATLPAAAPGAAVPSAAPVTPAEQPPQPSASSPAAPAPSTAPPAPASSAVPPAPGAVKAP